MKIRYLSLIVLLVMSVFAPIQAQTYDNLWKELEVLERKDLPQSVISKAMKIYDKAKSGTECTANDESLSHCHAVPFPFNSR
jgi:hypothetical protein